MVSEKELFWRNLWKIFDLAVLLLAFISAYFMDEMARQILGFREKAYAIAPDWEGFLYFYRNNFWMIVLFPPIWLVLMGLQGLYHNHRTKSFNKVILTLMHVGFWATVTSASLAFLLQMNLTSRLYMATYSFNAILLLIIEKKMIYLVLDFLNQKGFSQVNILIVGTGKRAQEFIRLIKKHSHWGFNIVGLIDEEHGLYGHEVEGYRVLGRLQDIPFILHRKVVDRVIFVVPRLWLHRIEDVIKACEREGIPSSIAMDLYNLHIAKIKQTDFFGYPLLDFETFSAKEWQLFIKRLIDIVLSLFFIIVFSPVMIFAILGIKLTSKGPILFKQIRSGVNGRPFVLYKFRSMIVGAEMKRRELEKMNEMDGPVFKIKKDPRITPIGRILRKTSIDELPQLFNVLKGDMSIVGPRPALPIEVEMYEFWQRRRLSLRPGITCIWQVSGRNRVSFERWMEMDLEYIDNWSLWLDIKLLIKTVFVVLVGYGAS